MAKKLIKQKNSTLSDVAPGAAQDRSVQIQSRALKGKKIALALCGGIGATEAVKIAREIRRHGGQVRGFVSPQAKKFITPLSVEWATLDKPVLRAGPRVEYLEAYDAVLVCPATLHTISKSALALAQNVVDLLIANQIGMQGLVLMVPAMNQQMWSHPQVKVHLDTLKTWGVKVLETQTEEYRLKVPDSQTLVKWLIQELR